jgi:probable F420-dependent oxidoreductase
MNLGEIGVWSFRFVQDPLSAVREAAERIEELGYTALWYPETPVTREAVLEAALLLDWTKSVAVCSGIAPIWNRDAVAALSAARGLNDAFDGRFVLGLGVSHRPSVEGRGHAYEKPLSAMRAYLDTLDGFAAHLEADPPPRLLAALAPRMLGLAAERADGAHTYFVPVEHTASARERLGPERTLAVELAVVLETDAARARDTARTHTTRYLALPNYRNNLVRLGFAEDELDDGGSDAAVDRVVAWGDEDAILRRVEEHLDAGADHVCIQPLGDTWVADLERLAPVLLRR